MKIYPPQIINAPELESSHPLAGFSAFEALVALTILSLSLGALAQVGNQIILAQTLEGDARMQQRIQFETIIDEMCRKNSTYSGCVYGN